MPTLLVHGEDDRIGDIAADTSAWARREPLAEYAVIPGAGHASNLDNPEAFTAALRAFLDRAAPPLELVDGSVSRDRATRSPVPAPFLRVAA